MAMISPVISCDHSMADVWECAINGKRYHNDCITAGDIHKLVREKTSFFARPYLLHLEGRKFQKLFADCDTNGDKCIHVHEASYNSNCVRDCRWIKTWMKVFCN